MVTVLLEYIDLSENLIYGDCSITVYQVSNIRSYIYARFPRPHNS